MAGKENLPKPPQLAHAFAYVLLTLYHSTIALSIVSREKYSRPFLRLFPCALPLDVPAAITAITRGLRPYKISVLYRKRSKRVILYNCDTCHYPLICTYLKFSTGKSSPSRALGKHRKFCNNPLHFLPFASLSMCSRGALPPRRPPFGCQLGGVHWRLTSSVVRSGRSGHSSPSIIARGQGPPCSPP